MTMEKEKQTVLDYVETTNLHTLKRVMTVERTTQSKYQFLLLVRHYRKFLRAVPRFMTYTKADGNRIHAILEERNLFLGEDTNLFALEGAPERFVEDIHLPRGTYLVAETDPGILKPEPYHYRERRNILRVLLDQTGLSHLSLRELLKLDWSTFTSYEEYEGLLWKAKTMGWNEEQIGSQLTPTEGGNLLTLTKKGQFGPVLELMQRYGPAWTTNHAAEILTDLIQHRVLRTMGYDDQKVAREMGLGWARAREIEEAAQTLTSAEVEQMVDRLLTLDPLIKRNPKLGATLYLLNAPIRLDRKGN